MNKLIIKNILSILILGSLISCGDSSYVDNIKLSKTMPTFQTQDHSSSYIDDNYKNYYQILVYSFYDSNNDGIGDINGIIEKLDYINDGNKNSKKSLGYDGIYLLPIFPSPTYHKYDAMDYYSIDPKYGTLEDFDKLIEECEKRGIDVILDLALNHTSGKHPWFLKACDTLSKIDNYDSLTKGITSEDLEKYPELNYYNFTMDANYVFEEVGINNQQKTFVKLDNSNWYYEEHFKAEDGMPDLNLGSSLVQEEVFKIMKFWLDKGVKGFRLDAVQHFFDGEKQKNFDFLNLLDSYANEITKNRTKKPFLVAEGPWNDGIIEFYQNTNNISYMNFSYGLNGNEKIPNLLDKSSLYNSVYEELTSSNINIEYNENYEIINNGLTYQSPSIYFKEMVELWDTKFNQINTNTPDSNFGSNHDTNRVINRLSGRYSSLEEKKLGCKLFWAINNTLSGVSYNYYGEEIGMRAGDRRVNADPNKRHAFNWTNTTFTLKDGVYVPNKVGVTNLAPGAAPIEQYLPAADEQMKDPNSLWNFIRQINHMKVCFPEIARGKQTFVKIGSDYVVMKKAYNDSTIHLVYNFRMKANSIPLNELGLEEEPSEIKYSLSSSSSYYSNLTADTLNVPAYSITII